MFTIQLIDLALNVDSLNEKRRVCWFAYGNYALEGWWLSVEVDELEIVLAPSKNGNSSSSHGFRRQDNDTLNSGVANSSVDVHEGVKTIAKMVKWLLTRYHVKIKKLIVAFDPLLEEENKKGLDRILVLRISEAECGTHISEVASSSSLTKDHSFLGLSRLTNFIIFQGAVVKLLHVDGIAETTSGDCCSSGNMTTVISGENGGFSGNLKLSLPWKNGSLDIREIEDSAHHEPSNGFSAPSSCMRPSDNSFVTNSCLMEKEPVHSLLSVSHLISDWVSKSSEDRNEEPDFGASVDQFFECFDELRSSQSALGNSGMWNWTCSVCSAITAASNLASGSLHISSEQQHVETNFNASIEKVSLQLYLTDEDQKKSPEMTNDKANFDSVCLFVVREKLM
ncbi:hypothetical protein CASFOL_042409 [Castilleja foliolosa]|uniref:Autophagy-related protein 2 n=1 Tax=Castilleja foliolosa TaxID=1961234 RepID=A0ABD3BBW5_9LAMI